MPERKILIVEDEVEWHTNFKRALKGYELIFAMTVDRGFAIYQENKGSWDAIFIDGHLAADSWGPDLVDKLKEDGYTGPMLACTGNPHVMPIMLARGCTDAVEKSAIPRYIREHFPL